MFKMKNTKLSSLFLLTSLIISSVFLAACGTTSDAEAAPISLQAPAADTLIESDTADVSQISEPANDDLANATSDEPTEVQTVGGHDNTNQARIADRSEHEFDPSTAPEITQEEIEGLIYMREEEKLARDVYLTLYEEWGIPVFQNIAGSEQAHMDSVLMLLDQYDLADPSAGLGVGAFSDPLFATLYDEAGTPPEQARLPALHSRRLMGVLEKVLYSPRVENAEVELVVDVLNIHNGDRQTAPAVEFCKPLGALSKGTVSDHEVVGLAVAGSKTRASFHHHLVRRCGGGWLQRREPAIANLDRLHERPAGAPVPQSAGQKDLDRTPVVGLDLHSTNPVGAVRE